MSAATLRLVLIVSCAHALVHVYEQSLPSVEKLIGEEFSVGPEVTGPLGTAWRIPFGAAALVAGWLADQFGSRRLLLVYLLGCSAMCVLAWNATSLPFVFATMFLMGSFASIYHPAGLALISHATDPSNRGRALGMHGVFGSLGIAAAPFLASLFFLNSSFSWRDYYALLAIPGVLCAVALWKGLRGPVQEESELSPNAVPSPNEEHWGAFFVLVAVGTMFGFIYAAFTHFLPRYLDTAGVRPTWMTQESFRTSLSAMVLVCGAVGQYVGGRLARPHRLYGLLTLVLFCNAPCLLWMAVAEGQARLVATCLLAFVHFMNQPVYNSLIAQLVPARHRSTGYGFSNMMCFGLGAFGPTFAGYTDSDWANYTTLGVIALVASGIAWQLGRWRHRTRLTS